MKGKLKLFNVIYNFFEVSWNKLMFVFLSSYMVYVWKVIDFEDWEFFMIFGGECFIRLIDLIFNIKYIVRVCVCVGIEIGFIGDESDVIIMKNLVFKIK